MNKYAEPGSWFSSSVKEYATFVEIMDPPETIRTGMTAEVRIFVEQLEDALQIPVQGIYEYKGHHFCLKKDGEGWKTVEIKIGATNDKMVTVDEGLAENDEIALNPRSHIDFMELPEIEDVEDRAALAEIAKAPMPKSDSDGAGGSAGGGGSGGGMGNPEAMADRTMSSNDKNNDGKLSADELSSIPEAFRDRIKAADTNGDGNVERAELVAGMKKLAGANRNRAPGGPGGPGGPGMGGGGPGMGGGGPGMGGGGPGMGGGGPGGPGRGGEGGGPGAGRGGEGGGRGGEGGGRGGEGGRRGPGGQGGGQGGGGPGGGQAGAGRGA